MSGRKVPNKWIDATVDADAGNVKRWLVNILKDTKRVSFDSEDVWTKEPSWTTKLTEDRDGST